MPQVGERKTKDGVTGEWDGATWRMVSSDDQPQDIMGLPATERQAAMRAMTPADLDREMKQNVSGQETLMGLGGAVGAGYSALRRGVGALRSMMPRGAASGAVQGAVENLPVVGRMIRGGRVGWERGASQAAEKATGLAKMAEPIVKTPEQFAIGDQAANIKRMIASDRGLTYASGGRPAQVPSVDPSILRREVLSSQMSGAAPAEASTDEIIARILSGDAEFGREFLRGNVLQR